jgi:hypothetical protein
LAIIFDVKSTHFALLRRAPLCSTPNSGHAFIGTKHAFYQGWSGVDDFLDVQLLISDV